MTDMTAVLSNVKARENSLLKNTYIWMTAGLLITALTSFILTMVPRLQMLLLGNFLGVIVLTVVQFSLCFSLSAKLPTMTKQKATGSFIGYSVVTGITLSTLVYAFSSAVLFKAFLVTALLFGSMSLYALTTKRSLDSIGSYAMMALWGILLSTFINMLFRSSTLDFVISIIAVVVFLGLTAWDTQKIKQMNDTYGDSMNEDDFHKISILCSLMLYLDFLNIFLYILRIFARTDDN